MLGVDLAISRPTRRATTGGGCSRFRATDSVSALGQVPWDQPRFPLPVDGVESRPGPRLVRCKLTGWGRSVLTPSVLGQSFVRTFRRSRIPLRRSVIEVGLAPLAVEPTPLAPGQQDGPVIDRHDARGGDGIRLVGVLGGAQQVTDGLDPVEVASAVERGVVLGVQPVGGDVDAVAVGRWCVDDRVARGERRAHPACVADRAVVAGGALVAGLDEVTDAQAGHAAVPVADAHDGLRRVGSTDRQSMQ